MSYTLNHSGEQVDEAVGKALGLVSGTETITTTAAKSVIYQKIALPFTPTVNTKVIATLRIAGTPQNPTSNFCLTTHYWQPTSTAEYGIYISICAGQNAGTSQPTSTIPKGTYYVDWLVTDKGE